MNPETQSPMPNVNQPVPPGGGFGRKRLLMIVGAVLLVIIIVIIALMAGGGKKDNGDTGGNQNVTYDRPGFDRAKLGEGIGDPAALVFKKAAAPVSYQGTNIVQACSVFGLDDVKQAGLVLRPHTLTVAFQRNYLDGQSNAAIRPATYLDGGGLESNYCHYTLGGSDDGQSLDVQVFQPPYSAAEALDYAISRNLQDAGTIGGFKAYKKTETDTETKTTTLLRSGDSALQVVTRFKSSDKTNAVVERAAANFTRLLSAPDGPPNVEIDSPLMPGGVANACVLLTPGDVSTAFATEVSPFVTEAATTAVGIITFTSKGKAYNFATHDCERRPLASQNDINSLNPRALKLEATTYRDEEAAKIDMQSHQAIDKQVQQVSTKVGDEVFYSNSTGFREVLNVRKGRYILRLSNSDKQLSSSQKIQQLTTAAQAVVGRIK